MRKVVAARTVLAAQRHARQRDVPAAPRSALARRGRMQSQRSDGATHSAAVCGRRNAWRSRRPSAIPVPRTALQRVRPQPPYAMAGVVRTLPPEIPQKQAAPAEATANPFCRLYCNGRRQARESAARRRTIQQRPGRRRCPAQVFSRRGEQKTKENNFRAAGGGAAAAKAGNQRDRAPSATYAHAH